MVKLQILVTLEFKFSYLNGSELFICIHKYIYLMIIPNTAYVNICVMFGKHDYFIFESQENKHEGI